MRNLFKTQLIEMVAQAWSRIPEEFIKKSFIVCGQGEELVSEEVVCMRERRRCNLGLQKIKSLLSAIL